MCTESGSLDEIDWQNITRAINILDCIRAVAYEFVADFYRKHGADDPVIREQADIIVSFFSHAKSSGFTHKSPLGLSLVHHQQPIHSSPVHTQINSRSALTTATGAEGVRAGKPERERGLRVSWNFDDELASKPLENKTCGLQLTTEGSPDRFADVTDCSSQRSDRVQYRNIKHFPADRNDHAGCEDTYLPLTMNAGDETSRSSAEENCGSDHTAECSNSSPTPATGPENETTAVGKQRKRDVSPATVLPDNRLQVSPANASTVSSQLPVSSKSPTLPKARRHASLKATVRSLLPTSSTNKIRRRQSELRLSDIAADRPPTSPPLARPAVLDVKFRRSKSVQSFINDLDGSGNSGSHMTESNNPFEFANEDDWTAAIPITKANSSSEANLSALLARSPDVTVERPNANAVGYGRQTEAAPDLIQPRQHRMHGDNSCKLPPNSPTATTTSSKGKLRRIVSFSGRSLWSKASTK